MVLIHHLPGWSELYIETTRRFAHHGYIAICANLHEREGQEELDAGARAGVELTLEWAKELRGALDRAIAAAEFEEAEVRGKGAVLRLVRMA